MERRSKRAKTTSIVASSSVSTPGETQSGTGVSIITTIPLNDGQADFQIAMEVAGRCIVAKTSEKYHNNAICRLYGNIVSHTFTMRLMGKET